MASWFRTLMRYQNARVLVCTFIVVCLSAWSQVTGQDDHASADLAAGALRSKAVETGPSDEVIGDFPRLPPDPYAAEREQLPPLEEELWLHGGSYLYQPEGDRLNWPDESEARKHDYLRLPEKWLEPRPLTGAVDFLGADPVRARSPRWGPCGYFRDVRFVGAGSYELLAFALEQNRQRQDVIGHNLLIDLDLRMTGTERFHVQFRPLGRKNTGGSFYRFSDPEGYENNSTGEPDRYWFEGELHSFLGPGLDPLARLNVNVVAGKFPFALHNSLLMNDDVVGAVFSRNNIYLGSLSNLNVQFLLGVNDLDTYPGVESQVYGMHATADYRHALIELTYAYVNADGARDTHYAGLSHTKFFGPLTMATRGFLKLGDSGGAGSAQLVVFESNVTRVLEQKPCGFNLAVYFCNAFWAAEGWNSIAGANFNRLRTAFEVNPLVRLAAGPSSQDVVGCSLGVQLFRNHEDESLVPELAYEAPDGESVFGVGLRYLKKTGPRTFLEMLGVINFSEDPTYDREGVFASHTIIF